MLQHKGLHVRLAGGSPSATCLLPHRTSSARTGEEPFPETEPFQPLCTALPQQSAGGVTRGVNAGKAGETQSRLSGPLASDESRE